MRLGWLPDPLKEKERDSITVYQDRQILHGAKNLLLIPTLFCFIHFIDYYEIKCGNKATFYAMQSVSF